MSTCVNCGSDFAKKLRGYRRFSISTLLTNTSQVKDIIEELFQLKNNPLTPLSKADPLFAQRCLCHVCYSDIQKIETKNGEIEELKRNFCERLKTDTYLSVKKEGEKRSRNVLTPSKTPRKEKKVKTARVDEGREDEPQPSVAANSPRKSKNGGTSFRTKVSVYILGSKYLPALRLLWRNSPSARKAFLNVVTKLIRKEMTEYSKTSQYTSRKLTLDTLVDFSWKDYFKETDLRLPVLSAALQASVTTRNAVDKVKIDEKGRLGPLVPGLGFALAILLNLKKNRRFNVVQSIISAQLYRHGCSQKLQTWLNKAGVSLSLWGGRGVIDRLITGFDVDAKKLKNDMEATMDSQSKREEIEMDLERDEEGLEMCVDETSEEGELKSTEEELMELTEKNGEETEEENGEETEEENGGQTEEDSEEQTEEETEVDTEEDWGSQSEEEGSRERKKLLTQSSNVASGEDGDKEVKRSLFSKPQLDSPSNGYSLTWDNVQHLAIRRHFTSEKKNTFHLWALAFMAENRINFDYLEDKMSMCTEASSLPLNTFLPSTRDWDSLKYRMEVLVKRILVKQFPEINDRFEQFVIDHIPHTYSDVSAHKSHIINLGVYEENPATTKGVLRIMKNLRQYVPQTSDGKMHSILVNGDQLSVERMVSARMAMASSEDVNKRLLGMEPSPQEFHKRCLLLQDTMNELYSSGSVAEKGTLYQIRTKFGHRAVKKHVMDCVNHCTDFFRFTTEGMVALLAMKLGHMTDMSGVPEGCPDQNASEEDKRKFFDTFATRLVESCWPRIYQSTIKAVTRVSEDEAGDDEDHICICSEKEISDTFTIQCSAREKCGRRRFYHPSCMGLEDSLPEDDWWCSDECKKFSAFCSCRSNKTDKWIGCESEELCIKAKQGWFHLSCVGLKKLPRGKWFCSEECRHFSEEHVDGCGKKKISTMDHVQEYSCAVVWEGLWHLAHRDAERENDGKAVISQWRLDMTKFWANNHYKYLTLGHRLLASIGGWLPPRLQDELIWNRMHNLNGGAGNNIPLDLINEFLNNDFKHKLQDDFFRTTQLVYSYEAGRMVPRLREPRNLYALSKELGPQQAARWPTDLQVLGSRIQHIRYVPPSPELFYQPTGQEYTPMVRGEEYGGRLVYEYETTNNFFVRSCVGGTKNGYSICCVPLMSDQDKTLLFESRFECGNLAKAIQVGEHDYELSLRYDFYTQKHTQWFYFRVTNTRTDTPYRFTIVNFMKPDSLYNNGMKPLMYSKTKAEQENIGWQRSGHNIKYYKNNKSYSTSKGEKPLYSLTWTVQFSHDQDEVYFAHCFPYSYSDLQDYLMELSNDPVKSKICKQRVLCRSLAGNLVYILTITSPSQNPSDIKYKRAVVITSRVHPGESNSSWMMKGFLDYLTGNSADAKLLRDTFVFKIVPMLNPDGVIVGNYRCSLSGRDLNRNYKTVLKDSFPPVWHTRNMIKRLAEEREIVVYCDLHGHSRKQNVFIYGCEDRYSSNRRLRERIFPMMLHKNAPDKFSFDSCKFKIQKSKEGTGRVVMWNMGIMNSFTMEATFCGSTLGKKKGQHFSVVDFEMLGYHFCDTLLDYCDPDNTKCVNVFVELEERLKKEILMKLENQGMATDDIDLNEEYMFELESTDGGSDSSASDGLPIHLQYLTSQSEKKKKKLKSRKERNKQRQSKDEGKKTTSTASTQVPAVRQEPKSTEKGNGQSSKLNKSYLASNHLPDERNNNGMPIFTQDNPDLKPSHRNEYLEALTHTYVQNGVLVAPEAATPHLRYSGNKLPAIAFNMEGLCPHHEQAVAAQYMSHQLRTLQPPVETSIEDFIHTHIHSNPTERLAPTKRHLLEIAVSREREQFIQGFKKKGEVNTSLDKPNSAEPDRGSTLMSLNGKTRAGSVTPIKSLSSQCILDGVLKGAGSTESVERGEEVRSLSKLSGDRTSDSDPLLLNSVKQSKNGKKSQKKALNDNNNKSDIPRLNHSAVLSNISKKGQTEETLSSQTKEGRMKKKSKSYSEDHVERTASKLTSSSPRIRNDVDMVPRSDLHVTYPDENINVGYSRGYKPQKTPFVTRRAYTTESRRLQQQEMMKAAALETVSDMARWKPKSSEKLPSSPSGQKSKLSASASQYINQLMQAADEEISELTTELEEDVKRELKLVEHLQKSDHGVSGKSKESRSTGASLMTGSTSRMCNSPLDWAVGCVQVSHVRMSPLDSNGNSVSANNNISREDTWHKKEQLTRMKSGKLVKRELMGAAPSKISLTMTEDHGDFTEQQARHALPSNRLIKPSPLRNNIRKH